MSQINKGSIQHLVIQIAVIAVIGFVLYPLFDLLVCLIFTHSPFVYSVNEYIIEPIIFAVIIGTVFWTIDRKATRKK